MITSKDEYELPAIKDKEQMRDGYKKMLANINTKYHLTITFPAYTEKKICEKLLNQLLKHLNRKVFKKRYSTGRSYLEGAVVRERTFAMDTDHFHILIADSKWLPSKNKLIDMLEQQFRLLGNDCIHDRKKNYIANYKLQDYYNNGDNKLEGYLTKLFEGRVFYERDVTCDFAFLHTGSIKFGE